MIKFYSSENETPNNLNIELKKFLFILRNERKDKLSNALSMYAIDNTPAKHEVTTVISIDDNIIEVRHSAIQESVYLKV